MNLEHIPILDHHAHSIYREAVWREAVFAGYFSEAYDPAVLETQAPLSIFFQRSVRDLADFYGCEPTLEAVIEARKQRPYLELAADLIRAANIDQVLLDDGFLPQALLSVGECDALLPWRARRILRLEVELATLVERHDDARGLLAAFEQHLLGLAPTLAAFKSVLAYRSGLEVQRWRPQEVEAAYSEVKRAHTPGEPLRLASKALLDSALRVALRVAHSTGLAVQFHTGYGDPDLDLRLADPLHLRPLFEDPELYGVKVVMLHCYPYTREAGYLASVYPGAYLDLGLTIPFTSQHAMRTHVHEALHLAPTNKVLFSTDASRTPELFYLAAHWGRRTLGRVLEKTVADGDLSAGEAEDAALRILRGNAGEIYPTPALGARGQALLPAALPGQHPPAPDQ